MKKNLFLVILATAFLFGCKSEQEKALDAAIATNDLNVLREFAAVNADVMEEKVKALYETTYNRLIKDSTLYSAIEQAEGLLSSYNAEKSYLDSLPNGIHASEVLAKMEEHKADAEEIIAYLDEIRPIFEKYKFVESAYIGSWGGEDLVDVVGQYEFLGPDESGKGTVIGNTKSSKYREMTPRGVLVHVAIESTRSGSYYIDADLKINLTLIEKRTYSGINEVLKEYAELRESTQNYLNNQLVPNYKKKYPEPKPRKLILTLSEDKSGFPTLSGVDTKGNRCTFTAAMK